MKYVTEMPDEKLIRFYPSNYPHALATLTGLYKDRIYYTIYTTTRDKYAAEEIFRNFFVSVINKLMSGKNAEDGNFLQCALQVAQNLCIDYNYKKSNSGIAVTGCNSYHDNKAMNDLVSQKNYYETHANLRRLINILPERQREILHLSHYGDASFREIACKMKCSVTNILDMIKFALVNLQKLLDEFI